MTKHEFTEKLQKILQERGLPAEEAAKSAEFYSEMIDDRIEDGMTEEQAISALGDIDEIAEKIFHYTPLGVLMKSKFKEKKQAAGSPVLLILLAILGFPIWFSLAIAALAILISIYIIIWAGILSVFSVVAAVGLTGVLLLPAAVFIISLNPIAAMGLFSAGFILVGLCILFFFPAKIAAKALVSLTVLIGKGIKSLFIRKSTSKEEASK